MIASFLGKIDLDRKQLASKAGSNEELERREEGEGAMSLKARLIPINISPSAPGPVTSPFWSLPCFRSFLRRHRCSTMPFTDSRDPIVLLLILDAFLFFICSIKECT